MRKEIYDSLVKWEKVRDHIFLNINHEFITREELDFQYRKLAIVKNIVSVLYEALFQEKINEIE